MSRLFRCLVVKRRLKARERFLSRLQGLLVHDEWAWLANDDLEARYRLYGERGKIGGQYLRAKKLPTAHNAIISLVAPDIVDEALTAERALGLPLDHLFAASYVEEMVCVATKNDDIFVCLERLKADSAVSVYV